MHSALLVLTAVILTLPGGCVGPWNPSTPAGRCSVTEPGGPTSLGSAAYTETRMPDVRPAGMGSLALTIACAPADPATGDELLLLLPYLAEGVVSGRYRVIDPDDLGTARVPSGARAFAFVRRLPAAPVPYVARAGSVEITAVDADVIHGAYRIALTPEDTARRGRLVLGGAFTARRFSP